MNREQIRQAVVALVEARRALWVGHPLTIEWEGRAIVDTQTHADPFLCVRVIYIDGEQVELGTNPNHRVWGQVHLAAAVRDGWGVAQANTLLDFFTPALHMRTVGSLRLAGARPTPKKPHLGWEYHPVLIPFSADTIP